jgi:DNA-binding Lrp family transcriptional regulator
MSRADDLLTLRILDYESRGWTLSMISRAMHMSKSAVHARVNRVRVEDTLHDPEARQYWRRDKGDPT